MSATLVLFTDSNLRLADHAALHAAVKRGVPVIPLFVLDEDMPRGEALGGAARWWLHHSLMSLGEEIASRGNRLVIAKGRLADQALRIAKESGADALYMTRQYTPYMCTIEADVQDQLSSAGITVKRYAGHVMHEPDQIRTGADKPYTVFSPFWKKCLASEAPGAPLDTPERLVAPQTIPDSLPVNALGLLPTIPWDAGFYDHWQPGSKGANERLDRFIKQALQGYHDARNRPDVDGTSALSPHIRFGEISTREIRYRVEALAMDHPPIRKSAEHYVRELGWRDFSYHLLYNFPHLPTDPLRVQFAHFPWSHSDHENDLTWLKRWQRGETGFPIVDAGMRQLWQTGWMHNRVRMIVASFLVKELLWHWRDGADWFWDCLVDADLASNSASWQWAAGCGADAAPYFRIFNPILQGEKFDPDGDYVRTYVPELASVPNDYLHRPFEAPGLSLASNGVTLGKTYPNAIVDRTEARDRALKALETSKATVGRLETS